MAQKRSRQNRCIADGISLRQKELPQSPPHAIERFGQHNRG
jgi:hypothetical protein